MQPKLCHSGLCGVRGEALAAKLLLTTLDLTTFSEQPQLEQEPAGRGGASWQPWRVQSLRRPVRLRCELAWVMLQRAQAGALRRCRLRLLKRPPCCSTRQWRSSTPWNFRWCRMRHSVVRARLRCQAPPLGRLGSERPRHRATPLPRLPLRTPLGARCPPVQQLLRRLLRTMCLRCALHGARSTKGWQRCRCQRLRLSLQ